MPKSRSRTAVPRAARSADGANATQSAETSAGKTAAPSRAGLPTVTDTCDKADAMYRAAMECCRQHARYARLVMRGACDEEQDTACEMATIADALLDSLTGSYAAVAARANGHADEEWWHRANRLLQASREYARRRRGCDHASRSVSRPSAERLSEITADYELQASALLLLHQAIERYRAARPEADLKT